MVFQYRRKWSIINLTAVCISILFHQSNSFSIPVVRTINCPICREQTIPPISKIILLRSNTVCLHSKNFDDEFSLIETPETILNGISPNLKQSRNDGKNVEEADGKKAVYTLFILTCFIASLAALDRVAMSIAILPISKEFGLSDSVKGQISSVFSIGYGLGAIPSGLLVAVFRPRYIMAVGVAFWSFATIATPLTANLIQSDALWPTAAVATVATNIAPLLSIRAVMGLAESVVLPSIQRIISVWVDPEKKSLAIATVFGAFNSGTMLAYLISPGLLEEFGWRNMFYLYGAAGLILLVPWVLFTQDSPYTPNSLDSSILPAAINDDEHAEDGDFWEKLADLRTNTPWKEMYKSPAILAMTAAHAANNWGLYNSLAWTPTFYSEQYGLNVRESAILSITPSIAGALGGVLAGFTADRLLSEGGWDRTTVRKIFQGISLLGSAACLLTLSNHIPEKASTAQALLTAAVGLQAFNAAGYGAANQEKAGEKWSGLLYSLTSLPGVAFGTLGVYATGRLLDLTGQDWSIVYGLTASINIVGVIPFLIWFDGKKEFD